jgi:putative inorganic carbon (HCO3(-)) transporter
MTTLQARVAGAFGSVGAERAVGWTLPTVLLCATVGGVIVGLTGSPWPAIAVAVIAIALAMLAFPAAATGIFLFGLYINLPDVAANLYGVPYLIAAGFIGILGLPLLGYLLRRQPLLVAPALPWMILYLGVLLASALVSASLSTSVEWIVVYVTEGVVLFFLVTNVIRSPQALRGATWALLLAGSLMGALSLHQAVTDSYDNSYFGFAQVAGQGFSVGEDVLGESIRQRRASGPVGEQNRYAQIMLVLLPLALARAKNELRPGPRIAAVGAAAFILAGTLLSFSRGALLALAVLAVLLVAWRYIRGVKLVLLAAVMAVAAVFAAPELGVRVSSLQGLVGIVSEEAPDPDSSIVGRLTLNLAALNTFLDHPIIGVGRGVYQLESAAYANELDLRHFPSNSAFRAHNLYLEVAAETGIVGLAAFGGIVIATLALLWRQRRFWLPRRPEYADVATGLILAVVAYLTMALFLHLSYERFFWLLLALANAAILVLLREARHHRDPLQTGTVPLPVGSSG